MDLKSRRSRFSSLALNGTEGRIDLLIFMYGCGFISAFGAAAITDCENSDVIVLLGVPGKI